ncbi:transporter substrate-binding domain-containing protein [Terasakiella sp. SH-1]|uniref:substrate-binding periplasmic protein n=1 Tax=Terasakiella sp. SH-1 TaxID=2560057 RepID=UPI001073F3A7|nr:transporter substrate-binding domain-containing protein [Terasakiella sp. SH-1]
MNYILRVFLLLFIALTLNLSVSHAEKPTKIIIGYEPIENPPYYLGTGHQVPQENPGLTVELLKQVANQQNVTLEFLRLPWKRAIASLTDNSINGLFDASFQKKRTKFARYPSLPDHSVDTSKALMVQRYVLYVKKGTNHFTWTGKSFDFHSGQKNIGIKLGYSIASDLKAHQATIEETHNSEKNIKKLLSDRIIAYAELEGMGDRYLATHPQYAQLIEKLEPPVRTKPYYLVFSHEFYKQYPQFCEAYWENIRSFKQTKAYTGLLKKYALHPN